MSEATVGTDLLARLRAAIDETERMARAVPVAEWAEDSAWFTDMLNPLPSQRQAFGLSEPMITREDIAHIARHDPASVLRHCATDRTIVELHPRVADMPEDLLMCETCLLPEPCPTIVALAVGYGIEDVNG